MCFQAREPGDNNIFASVIILPYRNPVVLAKAIATADVLSKGRVIFGAAIGNGGSTQQNAVVQIGWEGLDSLGLLKAGERPSAGSYKDF